MIIKKGVFMKSVILANLKNSLPEVFSRKEAAKLTGGLISPRFLANLDSSGLGPKGRVRFGRKIGYEREAFIAWLSERMQNADL